MFEWIVNIIKQWAGFYDVDEVQEIVDEETRALLHDLNVDLEDEGITYVYWVDEAGGGRVFREDRE